jgi:hypothetical protein
MASGRQLIPLAKLRLNKENDRHGPLPSEAECVQWLLAHHEKEMLNLARSIAGHGLSPIDLVLVLPGGDEVAGTFNVWEGNRRVAALKLLDDSNRCHDPVLRRKFSDIRGSAKVPMPTSIECVIASSMEEADRLIELRHQGAQEGIGTVPWTPKQKDRHQQRQGKKGRYEFSSRVIDAVLDKVEPNIKEMIEETSFPVSTLDRILKNPDAQKFLGITSVGGIPQLVIEEKEALKGIKKILSDVAGGMHVRQVYNSGAIRAYLKKFEKKDRPDLAKSIVKPKPLASSSALTSRVTPNSRALSRKRRKLVPNGVSFRVKDSRLNDIYHELRSLDVDEARNAVAVLHRVFLELAIDAYLDHYKIAFADTEKLKSKAQKVVNNMSSQGWLTRNDSKGINSAISGSRHGPHSVDTFHAYVHNRKFKPLPADLNEAFDNLQPFYTALFKNLP